MLCMVGLFMRRQCVARRVAAGPFGALTAHGAVLHKRGDVRRGDPTEER